MKSFPIAEIISNALKVFVKKMKSKLIGTILAILWGIGAFITMQFGINYFWVYLISGFILTIIILIK